MIKKIQAAAFLAGFVLCAAAAAYACEMHGGVKATAQEEAAEEGAAEGQAPF